MTFPRFGGDPGTEVQCLIVAGTGRFPGGGNVLDCLEEEAQKQEEASSLCRKL